MNITPEQWTRIVETLGGVLVLVIGALATAIALIIKQRFDNQREPLTIRTHIKQAASDVAAVRAETSHNHGSSMKDKVDRIDDPSRSPATSASARRQPPARPRRKRLPITPHASSAAAQASN